MSVVVASAYCCGDVLGGHCDGGWGCGIGLRSVGGCLFEYCGNIDAAARLRYIILPIAHNHKVISPGQPRRDRATSSMNAVVWKRHSLRHRKSRHMELNPPIAETWSNDSSVGFKPEVVVSFLSSGCMNADAQCGRKAFSSRESRGCNAMRDANGPTLAGSRIRSRIKIKH